MDMNMDCPKGTLTFEKVKYIFIDFDLLPLDFLLCPLTTFDLPVDSTALPTFTPHDCPWSYALIHEVSKADRHIAS